MEGLCYSLAKCLACGILYWRLQAVGWSWVLALRQRCLGELLPIDITWVYEVSGWSNVLILALPPQRLRPDARPEHQDPLSHTAQKKREKKRKKENNKF